MKTATHMQVTQGVRGWDRHRYLTAFILKAP